MLTERLRTLRENQDTLTSRITLSRGDSKPIGYIGWAGRGNLGDDAMFYAAQSLMPDRSLSSYLYPGRENRLKWIGLSGERYFDSIILGGGTLITPIVYPDAVRTAISQGLPIWSLGTGVGSCGFETPDDVDIALWKPLLSHFRAIGVRGPRSADRLRQLGFENVNVVGDLALSLRSKLRTSEDTSPGRFAVNVALPTGLSPDEADLKGLNELALVVSTLISEGRTPVPVAMTPSDVTAIQTTIGSALLPHHSIEVPRTADEFFKTVRGCEFMIAVRLHAAVLSSCIGVPPLMLGYRDKCLDFMESLGLSDWHLSMHNAKPGQLFEAVRLLSSLSRDLHGQIASRVQSWQNIQRQFVAEIRENSLRRS